MTDDQPEQKPQPPMTPLQAMDFLSLNLAQLNGKRQDHVHLLQAEQIVRNVLLAQAAVQKVQAVMDIKPETVTQ